MNEYQISQATKRSQGGRKYLDFKTTFFDSKAKKDSDEFWSEGFSEETVKEIIDACNKTGMPAELEIKLKLAGNDVLTTFKFPILPTLVTHNLNDYLSSTTIAYYGSPELLRKQTALESKKDPKTYDALVKDHEELIKEYVRIELVDLYFKLLSGDVVSKSVTDYIKNLTIIKEKYDLDKIDLADVQNFKISEGIKSKSFEELLEDFASSHATQNKNTKKVAVVYGYHTNIIGLLKPQTSTEIADYAKSFSDLSKFRRKLDLSFGFMDDYKARKEKPYLRTKSLIPLNSEESPSGYQPN